MDLYGLESIWLPFMRHFDTIESVHRKRHYKAGAFAGEKNSKVFLLEEEKIRRVNGILLWKGFSFDGWDFLGFAQPDETFFGKCGQLCLFLRIYFIVIRDRFDNATKPHLVRVKQTNLSSHIAHIAHFMNNFDGGPGTSISFRFDTFSNHLGSHLSDG